MMKYPNRISVCKKNCSKIKWDQCLSTTLSKTESHTRVVYRQKPSPFHFAPMLINQQLSAVSTHTRTDTKAYRQTHSSLSLKCVLNWAGKWGWVTWSPLVSPRDFFFLPHPHTASIVQQHGYFHIPLFPGPIRYLPAHSCILPLAFPSISASEEITNMELLLLFTCRYISKHVWRTLF